MHLLQKVHEIHSWVSFETITIDHWHVFFQSLCTFPSKNSHTGSNSQICNYFPFVQLSTKTWPKPAKRLLQIMDSTIVRTTFCSYYTMEPKVLFKNSNFCPEPIPHCFLSFPAEYFPTLNLNFIWPPSMTWMPQKRPKFSCLQLNNDNNITNSQQISQLNHFITGTMKNLTEQMDQLFEKRNRQYQLNMKLMQDLMFMFQMMMISQQQQLKSTNWFPLLLSLLKTIKNPKIPILYFDDFLNQNKHDAWVCIFEGYFKKQSNMTIVVHIEEQTLDTELLALSNQSLVTWLDDFTNIIHKQYYPLG